MFKSAAVLLAAGALLMGAAPAMAQPAHVPLAVAPVVTKVIGTGTPASCTPARVAAAVRTGGNISFNCGPNPVTIVLDRTLFTCNTNTCKHPWEGGLALTTMRLDGGGLVTLSGGGLRGIYYSNSCEETFGWVTDRCDLQTTLHVSFVNIGFTKGNATKGVPGKASVGGGGGGGAIAMRGGTLTITDSWFTSNHCILAHSDAGGGAVRVVGMKATVKIEHSTFKGNWCANGGAISSLGASMLISDSTITGNNATGTGASSGKGGNGGGVYFDGGSQTVKLLRTTVTGNKAHAGGSGVFYVSNNRAGTLSIQDSRITGNTGETFWTKNYHDLFYLGRQLAISGSVID